METDKSILKVQWFKITTVKKVWRCDLNFSKIWWNFCFDQELIMAWEALSNTRKGISSDFRTLRILLRLVVTTYFFVNPMKHSLFVVFDILLSTKKTIFQNIFLCFQIVLFLHVWAFVGFPKMPVVLSSHFWRYIFLSASERGWFSSSYESLKWHFINTKKTRFSSRMWPNFLCDGRFPNIYFTEINPSLHPRYPWSVETANNFEPFIPFHPHPPSPLPPFHLADGRNPYLWTGEENENGDRVLLPTPT